MTSRNWLTRDISFIIIYLQSSPYCVNQRQDNIWRNTKNPKYKMYALLFCLLCYASDSGTEIDTLVMKGRQDLKALLSIYWNCLCKGVISHIKGHDWEHTTTPTPDPTLEWGLNWHFCTALQYIVWGRNLFYNKYYNAFSKLWSILLIKLSCSLIMHIDVTTNC